MWEVRACRVCLARDVRIEPPEKHQLQRVYELITGLQFKVSSGMPEWLCYECAACIRRCGAFRGKCHRSDEVLRSIYDANDEISEEDIEHVDRSAAGLISCLSVLTLDPVCIQPDGETALMKGEETSIQFVGCVESFVKKEEEIVVCPLPVADELLLKTDSPVLTTDSPLPVVYSPAADSRHDSDSATKDEPLANLKCGPKKGKRTYRKTMKSKKTKLEKLNKETEEKGENESLLVNKRPKRKRLGYRRSYYEQVATITRLSREQQLDRILKRKETPNYINSLFKCDLCFKGFICKATFKNHMLKHDPVSGDYKCDICHGRFKTQAILKKHNKHNHDKQYACKTCSHISFNPYHAQLHDMWHKGQSYQCKHCDESFLKNKGYTEHMRRKHPTHFVCDICNKAFASEQGIRQHKNLIHNREKKPVAKETSESEEDFSDVNKKSQTKDKKASNRSFEHFATVTRLSREQQLNEIVKRKETANYINSPYKCDLCFKGFSSKSTLETHMLRHDPVSGYYECDTCHRRFKTFKLLKKHTTANHDRMFTCKRCGHTSTHPKLARRHQQRHQGDDGQGSEFVCDVCGDSFIDEAAIKQHRLVVHHLSEPGPTDALHCTQCDVEFATDGEYKQHLPCSTQLLPNNERLHECSNCGQMFENLATLNAHVLLEHARSARVPAPARQVDLFPKKCAVCEMEVNSKREYWLHFRREHKQHSYPKPPGSYTCEVCGLSFRAPCFLRRHQPVHTGERAFACVTCGKTFANDHALKSHALIHTGGKLQKCDKCGKILSTKGNLWKHMRLHTGDMRYSCEYCNKKFSVPSEMRAHRDHVHLKVPWPKRVRDRRKPTAAAPPQQL